MPKILEPDNVTAIVREDGKMFDDFSAWAAKVSDLAIAEGSGSPEGVLEAQVTKLYMDTAGTAGNIVYIKRDTDIGGDKSKGWILI